MVKYVLVKYVTETKVLNVFAATKRLRPSPLVFVWRRMRFLILGRSVGQNEKKKNLKKKSEEVSEWEALVPQGDVKS